MTFDITAVVDHYYIWYCLNHEGSMNQENGPLVTDEPVEYEK